MPRKGSPACAGDFWTDTGPLHRMLGGKGLKVKLTTVVLASMVSESAPGDATGYCPFFVAR
jgi:hypothetical protein